MTHVTCRLTAKNRDKLRNPTLGNRVWATFFTRFRGEARGRCPGEANVRTPFCLAQQPLDARPAPCRLFMRSTAVRSVASACSFSRIPVFTRAHCSPHAVSRRVLVYDSLISRSTEWLPWCLRLSAFRQLTPPVRHNAAAASLQR